MKSLSNEYGITYIIPISKKVKHHWNICMGSGRDGNFWLSYKVDGKEHMVEVDLPADVNPFKYTTKWCTESGEMHVVFPWAFKQEEYLSRVSDILPKDKVPWDSYFFGIAMMVSTRSDCGRRQFGCIAVSPDNRVVATGYNAPPKGVKSAAQKAGCFSEDCCKGKDAPQNSSYDSCNAIHAEQNCLLQLGSSNQYEWVDLYIVGRNASTGKLVDGVPCIHCSRFIRNFNVRKIHRLNEAGETKVLFRHQLELTV